LKNLCKEDMKIKKDLVAISENSDKWQELNQKWLMIENQIDQTVYEIYGLTPEEIKIVEKA